MLFAPPTTQPVSRTPPVIRTQPPGGTDMPRLMLLRIAGFVLFTATWLSLLGPIAPGLMMAAALTLVALAPHTVFIGLARCWPILVVGGLAILSALWSTDPQVSLRYGVQLAITLVSGVVLASVLGPKDLLRVFFVSSFVVLILCLLSGRQGGSPQGPVLIGVLGSKNEMGQLCQLAICSAASIACVRSETRMLRLLAVPAGALAALVLAYTFATGAVLTTLVFLIAAGLLIVASKLSAGAKLVLALFVVALALPLWLIRADLVQFYEWVVMDVLGKDLGLTGRDYLWAHADRMIGERPVLGYGYRSTWLGSGSDTIGLLRWAGVSTGAGFNFHDTFREWAVDFGLVGAVVVAVSLLGGMARVLGRSLSDLATGPGVFLAASVIVLIARAKVETIFGPFSSSSVLIAAIAAAGYLQTSGTRVAAVAASVRTPGGGRQGERLRPVYVSGRRPTPSRSRI